MNAHADLIGSYAEQRGGGAEEQTPVRPWPTLDAAALHGLAGAFVRLVEPASEADPVAILVQFLVAFGNALNRGLHFRVEAAQHTGNLFAAIVGQTSKGRKGTSWDQVVRLMRLADDGWCEERVASGLSSGEGLLWHVRDPITKPHPIRDKQRVVEYQEVLEDPGVTDKRLLVLETEFAKVLRAMKRDGSSLSATLRQAWDSDHLRILTKNSPVKATGAHISVVAHITAEELRAELEHTEVANGFLNRFLVVLVRRSKCLPDGGDLPPGDLQALARQVSAALESGRRAGELRRDAEARARWHAVYPTLSEGRAGLLGAVTSRAEAQVTRLSCLYAALDRASVIRRPHLEAALALWQYCEDSARHIFGESLGDPALDRLLGALRAAGTGELTRTQISRDVFAGNASKAELDRVLQRALDLERAQVRRDKGSGRATEFWSYRSSSSSNSSGAENHKEAAEGIGEPQKRYEINEIQTTDYLVPPEASLLGENELHELDELAPLPPGDLISDDGGEWEPPPGPPPEDTW